MHVEGIKISRGIYERTRKLFSRLLCVLWAVIIQNSLFDIRNSIFRYFFVSLSEYFFICPKIFLKCSPVNVFHELPLR